MAFLPPVSIICEAVEAPDEDINNHIDFLSNLLIQANRALVKKNFKELESLLEKLTTNCYNDFEGNKEHLFHVFAVDIKFSAATNNFERLKKVYSKVLGCLHLSRNPETLANIYEECGKMYMKLTDWIRAEDMFFKSFQSYHKLRSPCSKYCLINLVVLIILTNSETDPFKIDDVHIYEKQDERILWIRALYVTYFDDDLTSFEKILKIILKYETPDSFLFLSLTPLLQRCKTTSINNDDENDDDETDSLSPTSIYEDVYSPCLTSSSSLVFDTSSKFQEITKLSKTATFLSAVKTNGVLLSRASAELKANKAVVLAAVKNNPSMFLCASSELQNDRSVVLAAVSNGPMLSFVPSKFKNDREIVMASASYRGWTISQCSKEYLNDYDVVLAAVNQSGCSIRYASNRMKSNRKLALAAVQQDGNALVYLDLRLKCDHEILLIAAGKARVLRYGSCKLRNDFEIVLAAVSHHGCELRFASNNLKNNRKIVWIAVQNNGLSLQYASEKLKNDPNHVIQAIIQNPTSLRFASSSLNDDGGLNHYINEFISRHDISIHVIYATFLYGSKIMTNFKYLSKDTPSDNSITKRKKSKKLHDEIDIGSGENYCILQMLNSHGQYHGKLLKKNIFEYIGVSVGKKWRTFQLARQKLDSLVV